MKPRITELEWLAAESAIDLDLYRSVPGQYRKWRLFGVACCRRAMAMAPDARLGTLADAAEQFADEFVTWVEVKKVRRVITAVREELGDPFGPNEMKRDVLEALDAANCKKPFGALGACHKAQFTFGAASRPNFNTGIEQERREQVKLAYDIFGNPFRPVTFDPSWRTSTAVGLARSMDEARDFAAMPILADALEEAGCDRPDVLAHCRDPDDGVHVRGCWVVDLVLGKS